MAYVERILGENERIVHKTHQHLIVLVERVAALLFAVVVFAALGLVLLLSPEGTEGEDIRLIVGLIALGSLILPLFVILRAWLRGLRGRQFLGGVWRAGLAGILILVVALYVLLGPQFRLVGWLSLALAAIPLFDVIRIVADWLNEGYIITNRRVMEIRGIINKHVRDSALEKVNDVELEQSVAGRLLGYGTVQIITGSDIGMNMFRRINNPIRFKREMLNAKERLHVDSDVPERRLDTAPLPSAPVLERNRIPDMLIELAELRQRGILSEEEFQAKKKDLLDRM
ncbi:MAG: hypothetical protein EHM56_11370 [Chloroflexi bacterium]|nr:MAG: hypothetical protein EHM56_11370 [Chloroflexota bacterium]